MERAAVSVNVSFLNKAKCITVQNTVLRSESGMSKIRARIEDAFGESDSDFVSKLDEEVIRIRRYSDSDLSVDGDDIIDMLDDLKDSDEKKIRLKIKEITDDTKVVRSKAHTANIIGSASTINAPTNVRIECIDTNNITCIIKCSWDYTPLLKDQIANQNNHFNYDLGLEIKCTNTTTNTTSNHVIHNLYQSKLNTLQTSFILDQLKGSEPQNLDFEMRFIVNGDNYNGDMKSNTSKYSSIVTVKIPPNSTNELTIIQKQQQRLIQSLQAQLVSYRRALEYGGLSKIADKCISDPLIGMIGIGEYENKNDNLDGVSIDYQNMVNVFGSKYKYTTVTETGENNDENNDENTDNKSYKLKWSKKEIMLFVNKCRMQCEIEKHDSLVFIISCRDIVKNTILDSYYQKVSLTKIIKYFNQDSCIYLIDKPKMFVIDCRQTKIVNESEYQTSLNDLSRDCDNNFCFLFSNINIQQNTSSNNKENGGILIHNVAKVFNETEFINHFDLDRVIKQIRTETKISAASICKSAKRDYTYQAPENVQIVESRSTVEGNVYFKSNDVDIVTNNNSSNNNNNNVRNVHDLNGGTNFMDTVTKETVQLAGIMNNVNELESLQALRLVSHSSLPSFALSSIHLRKKTLQAPHFLYIKRIFPHSLQLCWHSGFKIKSNQVVRYFVKELNHHENVPAIAAVDVNHKNGSDICCWLTGIKEKTNYRFEIYGVDKDTKEESPLSQQLSIRTPNFQNLLNPGCVAKIEWFYDKEKDKIGLFWSTPQNVSCNIGYCVYVIEKQICETEIQKLPVYIQVPSTWGDCNRLVVAVKTVAMLPIHDKLLNLQSNISDTLVIDEKMLVAAGWNWDHIEDEEESKVDTIAPAKCVQSHQRESGKEVHREENKHADSGLQRPRNVQKRFCNRGESHDADDEVIFSLNVQHIHSKKSKLMSFDNQTNFNQFKRAIFDKREELEISDTFDFNTISFGVVVDRNNLLPLDVNNFETVMNGYFIQRNKMLCLFGWEPVEVKINKVDVSTDEAGVLMIDFECDATNDYLVCELEIKGNDAYITINDHNVETKTVNLSDKEKVSPLLLRELKIGNEYRARFGARNDLFSKLKWCHWSHWCKMRDISADIWANELERHRPRTSHQMSQQGDENPVKVELDHVKDIFIWGLKRPRHHKAGDFFLNILGSQDNVPLTPVGGDDDKCCVYHTQLTLGENERVEKGLYFQISLIGRGDNNTIKKTLIGNVTHSCNPKPRDVASSSWRIPPAMGFFLLDFRSFDKKMYYTLADCKQEYYGDILETMFDFLIKKQLNIDVAPAKVLNILFASHLRINDECSKGRYNHNDTKLSPKKVRYWNKKVEKLCNDSIEHNVILDWQTMIRNLTLMCFLAMLPQTDKNYQIFYVNGYKAFAIYKNLIDAQKFGNKETIRKQLSRLLGGRMQKIQSFFWDCAFYNNPKNIDRYYWILWLNLLYDSSTSDEHSIAEKMVFDLADRMNRRPAVLFQHSMKSLHGAVLAELSLKLEKRVLPLEIEATKLFVDSSQDGKYHKYFFDILSKVDDLVILCEILDSNKADISTAMQSDLTLCDSLVKFILKQSNLTSNRNLSPNKYEFENQETQNLINLCVELVAPCVQKNNLYSNSDEWIERLRDLLTNYGYCLLNVVVRPLIAQAIIGNPALVTNIQFVGFYKRLITWRQVHVERVVHHEHKKDPDHEKENEKENEHEGNPYSEEKVMERLNQCFESWCGVSFSHCMDIIDQWHISWKLFNDYFIKCNDVNNKDRQFSMHIDSILPASVKGNCELIKNENLSIEVKRIIAKYINYQFPFVTMKQEERRAIYDVCVWFLKRGMVDIYQNKTHSIAITDKSKQIGIGDKQDPIINLCIQLVSQKDEVVGLGYDSTTMEQLNRRLANVGAAILTNYDEIFGMNGLIANKNVVGFIRHLIIVPDETDLNLKDTLNASNDEMKENRIGNDRSEIINRLYKCFNIWLNVSLSHCIDIIQEFQLQWKFFNQFIVESNNTRIDKTYRKGKFLVSIDKLVSQNIKKTCELMQHDKLSNEVKHILVNNIQSQWDTLNDAENKREKIIIGRRKSL